MACETRLRQNQTLVERMEETRKALRQLESKLQNGSVQIRISPQGAVQFANWSVEDRNGLSDVCGYRILSATNSFALKQAVLKAEQMSGRKVNPAAIGAGYHTHDGKNWVKH